MLLRNPLQWEVATEELLRELTQDVPKPSWLSCCLGTPRLVTSVTVHAASGLSVLGKNQDPAVHVTIHCEGKKVTSRTVRGRNPEFDLKGVFYRKREQRPIVVQVWQSNCLRDTLLGSVSVPCTSGEIDQTSVLKIQGKEGRSAGYIMIETSTSSDLTML